MINSEPLEAKQRNFMPKWLLVVPPTYLVLLVGAVFVRGKIDSFDIHGLSIPTSAIWFGALGGVVASLQGIFAYNKNWNSSYNIWHVFAGLVGAVYGLISYLFLLVIVKSTVGSDQMSAPIFALAAFSIGYGQSNFHSMMDEVFSIIFHPTKSSAGGNTAPKP